MSTLSVAARRVTASPTTTPSAKASPTPPSLATACGDLVTLRQLEDRERSPAGPARGVPLVIGPKGRSDVAFLTGVIREHTDSIKRALYEHGAVLFRGFRVVDEKDFEKVMLSVRGLRTMVPYGNGRDRSLVPGTEHVYDTSTIFRSGGDWTFGGFHCECYFTPDMPSVLGFCCITPPWLGGETALTHMANAYDDFDPEFRARLEARACQVNASQMAKLTTRYNLPLAEIERFIEDEQSGTVKVEDDGERKWAVSYKPSVLRHPYTGRLALQVNLSVEARKVDTLALEHFLAGYRGLKWSLHRLAWKYPKVQDVLAYITHLPRAFSHPQLFGSFFLAPLRRRLKERVRKLKGQASEPKIPSGFRFRNILTPDDYSVLAAALWKHTSAFTWRQGDVLLVDNLQMMHAGMPGFGPRVIRTMMCNPAPFQSRFDGIGEFDDLEKFETHRSMHDRLIDLGQQRSA